MNKDFEQLDDAIEELTTTGKDELDADYMKTLKILCRRCTQNLTFTYRSLLSQLEQPHSEIRYSAFQVMDQLFMRSHPFRLMVLSDLQDIFVLVVGSKQKVTLPPPINVATKLRKFFLAKFYSWYKKFGPGYRKLVLGFEFLRDVMKVKFHKVEIQTLAEQEKEARSKEKDEDMRKNKLQQVNIQYYDRSGDIETSIKEMENCFELLIKKISKSSSEIDITPSDHVSGSGLTVGNEAGLSSHNFTLKIQISKKQMIQETSDNEHLIQRLRELFRENRKYEEDTKRWLNILLKCESKDQNMLQTILNFKNTLSSLCSKYLELDIKDTQSSDDDDEGVEFIDVPEKNIQMDTSDDQNPSCSKYLTKVEKEIEENIKTKTSMKEGIDISTLSTREKHLKVAPIIKFDSDLKFWEKTELEIGSVKYDSLHRFWKTNEHQENFVPSAIEASMRERCFKYESQFEPVNRKCGALLPSGRFCERMDREKCPFHGKIVERDPFGRPIREEDIERENEMKRKHEEKEKKQIQKDIEATLGTSLLTRKKRRKSTPSRKEISRERYNRLTKLNKKASSREQLQKRILSVRSLDRISDTMNTQIRRRHMERFGSNFNY